MLDERNTLADTFAPSLPPPKPPSGPEVGFVESYEAGLESQRALRNLAVIDAGVSRAYQDRINRVKEATGVELRNPNLVPFYERMFRDDPHSHFRRELHKLAEQHPDKRDIIMPDIPPDAAMLERARAADRADQNLAQRPGTVAGAIGGFVGAARGMIEDPLNAAAMLVGPWGHVGLGAKAMLWAAVKNGAANAAVEAGQAPFVQGWRKKAGLDYGVSHAALDIGGAFAAGFALDIGIRGAYRGARRATGSAPMLDESGGVIRWRSQDAALDHAARTAAKSSRVRQAVDGDIDSLHMVAKEVGVADDPAYRGARQAARIEDELGHANGPEGVPEGDHYNAVIAALEAERFGEPMPPAPRVVPDARGHVLSDGSAPPAQAFEKDGKPVTFESIDPATLTADPATFQFRGQVDARGVTGRMSGIETWDQMAAGKVVVFERENGERVIADGHHRLELARRLRDQGPQLDGYVFRERDGWTPEDVAAYAAKKNMMDSPRVDPVDAARVLRARPDLVDSSLPLRDGTLQVARHLARLSDEAFDMVVGGVVEPGHAALVGQTVRDHELHAGILTEMARNEPRTLQEARLLLSEITIAPSTVDEQMTLFGLQSFMRPLMRERVAVLDRALRTLSADRRVFGLLGRESGRIEQAGNLLADRANAARAAEAATVQEVIERLATQPGPINDWLNDAARAVAAGEKPKHMGEALARRVSATLEKDGLAALMHHAEPPPARIDDPAGPEAKAQVEQMRRDLAQEIKDAADPEAAAARHARIAELEQGVLLQLSPANMHRTLAAADKWEEIGKALRDTLRMLPRDVKLRVEEKLDVFGGAADGFWHPGERLIYVAMTGADPVRTARHETIHALRGSGLMTDAEFDTLYRFAEASGLRKTYGVDLTYKELYTAKYGDRGEAHIEALLREETVAEMFADYSLNGKRFGSYDGGGVVDGIVDRLVRWMKGLRDALHDLGFKNVRDVFEEIESGRMAMRRLPRGADDAGFGAAMRDGARLGDLGDAAEACRA